MGIAPNLLIMGGATALQASNAYRSGRAAEESYKKEAAETIRQSAFSQDVAIEKQIDVLRQGRAAKGRARTTAAKSGLRTKGSVRGQVRAIDNLVERRLQNINLIEGEQSRRAFMQARNLRKQGKVLARTGRLRAIETSLLGGVQLGATVHEAGGLKNIFRDRG
jgi:hypothetical protein